MFDFDEREYLQSGRSARQGLRTIRIIPVRTDIR